MKKLLTIILLSILLMGCSGSSNYIMIKSGDTYGLLELKKNANPAFIYDSYIKIEKSGYIVTKKGQYGYIDLSGSEMIPMKKYDVLEHIGDMIVGYKKEVANTVFNLDGDILYKKDKETSIKVAGLPIVKQKKEYIVLDGSGSQVLKSDKEIKEAIKVNPIYTFIRYKDKVSILNNKTKKEQKLKIEGDYRYKDFDEKTGFLFYNENSKKIAYVDMKFDVKFEEELESEDVYFDKSKNIIGKVNDTLTLLSKNGKNKILINSYYQDDNNYIVKNDRYIYGPHMFYQNGEKTEVEGKQLDPTASYTKHSIFPIYAREKGYQYYTFAGKEAFDKTFRNATTFDYNDIAIVSEDGKVYYLMDKESKKLSKEYQAIEWIGKQYYIAYTTENRYEILDNKGKVLLDTDFMGSKQIVSYQDTVYGIFAKNGRSYIYDMNTEKLVFECEGTTEFDKEGYFLVNGKIYYSMKGEKIYSR